MRVRRPLAADRGHDGACAQSPCNQQSLQRQHSLHGESRRSVVAVMPSPHDRRLQPLRIRLARMAADVVGDARDDGAVVRNEVVRELILVPQLLQQVPHLRLPRHTSSAGTDSSQIRMSGLSVRQRAMAMPAGEFVRVGRCCAHKTAARALLRAASAARQLWTAGHSHDRHR